MTNDPLAAAEPTPPRKPPGLRQRAKDVIKEISRALAWTRSKVGSIGVPTVHRNDVLADVFAFLDAHGLDADTAFHHWKAAVAIARQIADDLSHVATKAVISYAPSQRVILIAFAVEEVLQYLAKHNMAGANDTNLNEIGALPIAPPNPPTGSPIAGKIEPPPDGPGRAA